MVWLLHAGASLEPGRLDARLQEVACASCGRTYGPPFIRTADGWKIGQAFLQLFIHYLNCSMEEDPDEACLRASAREARPCPP